MVDLLSLHRTIWLLRMDANLPEINITKGLQSIPSNFIYWRFWGDFFAAIKPTFAKKGICHDILSAQH